ncbi:hypothetical protein KJ612_12125, partial [Myxococcota bacterium]|nr:hypothetical protein [Myxococcota bacterium]
MTPFPRIPRWFFSVILATALLAFAACGKTAHTRSSKAVSEPVAVKKAPPAKPAGPAVEPDAGKADADEQPITPAGLIATLEGHLDSELLELPQGFLGVVGKALGKPLMPGSFLKALVVQSEDGFVGAFLGVVPPGHVPCSEEPSERPRVFWVSKAPSPAKDGLRILELSSQVFDGGLPRLEMPETYPGVPFVELQDSRLCPMPGAMDPADSPEGQLMEAWGLTAEGPRLIRRLESISEIPAGHSRSTTGTLSWIRTDGGAFYLAAR